MDHLWTPNSALMLDLTLQCEKHFITLANTIPCRIWMTLSPIIYLTRSIDSRGILSRLWRTRRSVSLFSYDFRRSIGFRFWGGFIGIRARVGIRGGGGPGLGLLFFRSIKQSFVTSSLLDGEVTMGFGMWRGGVGAWSGVGNLSGRKTGGRDIFPTGLIKEQGNPSGNRV